LDIHIPDKAELAEQLRIALLLPETTESGKEQMQNFQAYLEEAIELGVTDRRSLQPARLSFCLSAFWHMQAPEIWMINYLSARQTLEEEGLYHPVGDTTEDYFNFFSVYCELQDALNLSIWELEHLFVWYKDSKVAVVEPIDEPDIVASEQILGIATQSPDEKVAHGTIQLLLAKIGIKFGYKVWIATNDRNRTVDGERLGDFSIEQLPYLNGIDPSSLRTIGLIDVLWLTGSGKIIAAFEVESTTSIFSGLLRMSDLLLALEILTFPIYIAVPEQRVEQVKTQLSRRTFRHLELHEICRYFTFEDLSNSFNEIIKWASDVTAINTISKKVGDKL
jgi:hypothetical protein